MMSKKIWQLALIGAMMGGVSSCSDNHIGEIEPTLQIKINGVDENNVLYVNRKSNGLKTFTATLPEENYSAILLAFTSEEGTNSTVQTRSAESGWEGEVTVNGTTATIHLTAWPDYDKSHTTLCKITEVLSNGQEATGSCILKTEGVIMFSLTTIPKPDDEITLRGKIIKRADKEVNEALFSIFKYGKYSSLSNYNIKNIAANGDCEYILSAADMSDAGITTGYTYHCNIVAKIDDTQYEDPAYSFFIGPELPLDDLNYGSASYDPSNRTITFLGNNLDKGWKFGEKNAGARKSPYQYVVIKFDQDYTCGLYVEYVDDVKYTVRYEDQVSIKLDTSKFISAIYLHVEEEQTVKIVDARFQDVLETE